MGIWTQAPKRQVRIDSSGVQDAAKSLLIDFINIYILLNMFGLLGHKILYNTNSNCFRAFGTLHGVIVEEINSSGHVSRAKKYFFFW